MTICKDCGAESGQYQLCPTCYKRRQEEQQKTQQINTGTTTLWQILRAKIVISAGMIMFITTTALIMGMYLGWKLR